jgi:hypothetical protein
MGMFHIKITMTVLLALQSCRRLCAVGSKSHGIPWLCCWLNSHALYDCCWLCDHAGDYNCAVSSTVMQCMVVVGSNHAGDYDHAVGSVIMQDTMSVLLVLQSCRGI